MRMLETGEIALSSDEATAIRWFIDNALERAWDWHTDRIIVETTGWEEGKRQLDPQLYDLALQIEDLQLGST